MKPYAKLCGYLFDWLGKPLRRAVLALFAIDLLLAVSRLRFCPSFTEFLNDRVLLYAAVGTLLLFLWLAQQSLHRFYDGSRGIYTLCTLPAPGWAFPAAAYTATAACILALAAAQIALAMLAYALFCAYNGPGEGLPRALLHSDLFRGLLPHMPYTVTRTLMYFELALASPFAFRQNGLRGLFPSSSPLPKWMREQRLAAALIVGLLVWIADELYFRARPTLRNALFCALFAACLIWDMYNWSRRPGNVDKV